MHLVDDIIVAGEDEGEHLALLEKVLQRLDQRNLTANKENCKFFQKRIEFCGHYIDAEGLHKTPDKIKAVEEAPRPSNTTQLRSFLGMVNYYHLFLSGLASTLAPLHQLLQAGAKWRWTRECEETFRKVKQMMASETVHAHTLQSRASHASAYGLGAVLSHKMQGGTEHPVAFASRTLSAAENNYAQIDKEALALIWGIKKFHHYLYGHNFTLITDHQPLTTILNPKKGLPPMTTARLQRYAIFLQGYDFDICFRNTSLHANADAPSRLPWETMEEVEIDEDASSSVMKLELLLITASQLKEATWNDLTLSKCYNPSGQNTRDATRLGRTTTDQWRIQE